jgi:hypothetical protein
MDIPCVGGMLDGKVLTSDHPEPVIHQNGLWLLRIHQPYPRRAGERVTERLIAHTDTYNLAITPEGPVYRCAHPVAGPSVGDELLVPSEGGGYDVWADRGGKLSPRPVEAP